VNDSDNIAFVIFGVTGDLAKRKLIPALYELALSDRLPTQITLIGFARRDWTDQILQKKLQEGVIEFARTKPINKDVLDRLLSTARYLCYSFDDPGGYVHLGHLLKELKTPNTIFYLATPPGEYPTIVQNIGSSGINKGRHGWTRVVIEKPYGRDLDSARALDKEVQNVFDEDQIYRIDHYLGKETVQNILVLRFANGIFEPLWNRRYIDHVQITVSETVGVGSRAGYYETAGVIRDIFQNHLMQLLCLTAMEAPVAFNADAVRDEKVKVLRALRPMRGQDALSNTYRAQYVSGLVNGKRIPGYKDEPGVSANSITETFLAARLFVDNWRWAGIPFFIKSGKCLPCRMTEISIHFRQVPLSLFNWRNVAGDAPNELVISIQPNEGITLTFGAKAPGPINQISPVKMDFSYQQAFGAEPPEAYERLLLDCLAGDATLFTRSDEVNAQWAFTTQILEAWRDNPVRNLPVYEAGTWGPPGADDFINRDGRTWRHTNAACDDNSLAGPAVGTNAFVDS
jgi:glucose-6-phosphate 1-dehydrogenase